VADGAKKATGPAVPKNGRPDVRRLLRYDADAVLHALATRAGGESVPVPE
jgi:hypothetical protein